MEETDYFKGTTNKEMIDYYKVDLYSRMEITLYTYPHEFMEENPRPWEHLDRCEKILYEFLHNAYLNAVYERQLEQRNREAETGNSPEDKTDRTADEMQQKPEERAAGYALAQKHRKDKVKEKMQELSPALNSITDDYLAQVKLILVDL